MVSLRCDCWSREWVDICHRSANGEKASDKTVLRYPDTNFRCSPTSPGVVPQLIAGIIEHRTFFEIAQKTNPFGFYTYREGRASFYEGHVDSANAGLEIHIQQVHLHHQMKTSNENLLRGMFKTTE